MSLMRRDIGKAPLGWMAGSRGIAARAGKKVCALAPSGGAAAMARSACRGAGFVPAPEGSALRIGDLRRVVHRHQLEHHRLLVDGLRVSADLRRGIETNVLVRQRGVV